MSLYPIQKSVLSAILYWCSIIYINNNSNVLIFKETNQNALNYTYVDRAIEVNISMLFLQL